MGKNKKNIEISEQKIKKRSPKYSKTKGNTWELKIAKELRNIGFPGVVTSRSESKRTDDDKVDLIDIEGKMFFYPQIKATQNTPSYFKIREESSKENKYFVLFWAKQEKREVNIITTGEAVILDKEFFYELIKKYIES